MSAFSKLSENARAPGRTLVLEPGVFADRWVMRPNSPVCVGLRLMAESDKTSARADAERLADELHPDKGPNWLDAFNDALMRQAVALGMCDPNDVARPVELLPFAEEQIRTAMTSAGVAFVFSELARYEEESSPLGIEASDQDLRELSARLLEFQANDLAPSLRRLLSHVLDELGGSDEEPEGADGTEHD